MILPRFVVLFRWSRNCSQAIPRKGPLPKAYDVKFTEEGWYDWWLTQFKDQPSTSSETVLMCLPPPNVTGNLHLGHALTVAIEDSLARWHRMNGREVRWIPGFDHAGIATQIVVERNLERSVKKRRRDMSREELIGHCNLWKDSKITEISQQLKCLGASLNWNQQYYTLDPNFQNAVSEAFITLYEQGLIRREKRIVNWSPYLQSTLSDIEVESTKIEGKASIQVPGRSRPVTYGLLHYIKYPVSEDPTRACIVVATTRPETLFGDVAVAVHPQDQKYGNLIGRRLKLPLTHREIPIIPDESVDPNFGTGAVKVTPAHSLDDFAVGQRHNLPMVECLNKDGTLTDVAGDFAGTDRFDAKTLVLDALNQFNFLEKSCDLSTTIPVCSRTGDVVEFMPMSHWFFDCRPLAHDVKNMLEDDVIAVYPKYRLKDWIHWVSKSASWCLSRQLWWGHRIPAYFCKLRKQESSGIWVVANSPQKASEKACKQLRVQDPEMVEISQDPDVLDTWFSSALIPVIIAGWPQMNPESSQFSYPLSLMETGHDILKFWVNCMALVCTRLTGKAPFNQLLLHGLIRDSQGRKMSKSLGNVIDPRDIVEGRSLRDLQARLDDSGLKPEEIALAKNGMRESFPHGISECGTDALRFCLLNYDVQTDTINFDATEAHTQRTFCNKIWQAFRYVTQSCENLPSLPDMKKVSCNLTATDKWILSLLSSTTATVNSALTEYQFHVATRAIFTFFWFNFCDIYLEYSKPVVWKQSPERLPTVQWILLNTVEQSLRLLAPFMPYLSEELYSRLPEFARQTDKPSVHQQPYPSQNQFDWLDSSLEADFEMVRTTITSVRSIRREFDISGKEFVETVFVCDDKNREYLSPFCDLIALLTKSSSVQFVDSADQLYRYVPSPVAENVHVHVNIGSVDAELIRNRLRNLCEKNEKELGKLKRQENSLKVRQESGQIGAKGLKILSNLPERFDEINKQKDRLESLVQLCETWR